jgi:formylglycine-generating enzyme
MRLWLAMLWIGCQGESVQSGPPCGQHVGGAMVRVGKLCIDATEVTRGEFRKYLLDPKRREKAPPYCSWNTTDEAPEANESLFNFPVGMVNFCDAVTYCAWAGKRLCGKIGGGMNDMLDDKDPTKSEWFSVCSVNGTQAFSYAGAYNKTKCSSETATAEPVDARSDCHAPSGDYAQILNLSGNVAEWEFSCQGSSPARMTECRYRGGGHDAAERTACAEPYQAGAETRLPGIGIRCCKDP